jgi:hypothetical protein
MICMGGSFGRVGSAGARLRVLRVTAWSSLLAGLVVVGGAAPAMAGINQELQVFSDCPMSNPAVLDCVYSTVTGGEFTLGSKTVQITKTIVLQGGLKAGSFELVPAADGNTLSKTPLTVPGGLVGVEGVGGEVTATAEVAGTVNVNSTALTNGFGTAVSLPLKVKLDNAALGESCYIGSPTEPISLALTTGTTEPPAPNVPISGKPAKLQFTSGGNIDLVPGVELVDNAFSVPGANGCGGAASLLVDPLVNNSAGVPAAAGKNTAIQKGSLEQASVRHLLAQAALPEIGRCVPAAGLSGGFTDSKCLAGTQSGTGAKYEWRKGPGSAPKFSSKGTKTTLQSAGGGQVACAHSSLAGEYTGVKSLTATLTLTKCVLASTSQPCQSAGASSGEIVSGTLSGVLGFISDEAHGSEILASIGVDLSHAPSLIKAACGGAKEELLVTGSAIGAISKPDKMSSKFTLSYSSSKGKQNPEQFEIGSPDTLSATLGSGAEAAGLTTKQKLTNEETIEIKGIQD